MKKMREREGGIKKEFLKWKSQEKMKEKENKKVRVEEKWIR